MIQTIKKYADSVPDYRHPSYTRHLLGDIIMIVFFAILGNANEWGEIETFAKKKEKWLRKYLELPYGIPTARLRAGHFQFTRTPKAVFPIKQKIRRITNCYPTDTELLFIQLSSVMILIKFSKLEFIRPKQDQKLNVRYSFAHKKGFPISRKAHKFKQYYNYSMMVATRPEPTVRPPSRFEGNEI